MEVASEVCSSPSYEITAPKNILIVYKEEFTFWLEPIVAVCIFILSSEQIITYTDASRVKNRGKLFYCRFCVQIISLQIMSPVGISRERNNKFLSTAYSNQLLLVQSCQSKTYLALSGCYQQPKMG